MEFSTVKSRFALLTDDASDPFAKKAKAKAKTSSSATATAGKSGTTANSLSSAQKKGKEKKTATTTGPTATKNKTPRNGTNVGEDNVAKTKAQSTSITTNRKPKSKSDLEWEAWERRDTEFVTAEYQSQLEEALLQSKLEFQKQQRQQQLYANNAGETGDSKPKTKKKKKVAVPISEFNESLSVDSNANQPIPNSSYIDDESLIQTLRTETQLELLRHKQHAEEKALLLERNAHFINGNGNANVNTNVSPGPESQDRTTDGMDDHDLKALISQLEKEKQALAEELDVTKARFKKLLSLLNDSELKEKVHLQRDLEKVMESNQEICKLNNDLNEELKNVYSQLEQERSRSHAALMDVKKMSEQTRRTHGRTQSQMELLP